MRLPRLFPAAVVPLFAFALTARADNWPGWRGPTGQGFSTEKNLPVKWSATENVKWKIPLPDTGNSTPIVWGEKVFLTQATEKGKKRSLICFARKDGSKLWEKTVEYDEAEPKHDTNTYCAASPATDGERVVVSHGSAGVFCYDLAGKELWKRDLGPCHHIWGNAASPVIYKNLVILNFGPNEKTFLIAMNKENGKDVWKVDEPGKKASEYYGSWSTPVIADEGGHAELVMSWAGAIKSYNPDSGGLLWSCHGLEKDKANDRLTYTSPLVGNGVVIGMAGFGGAAIGVKTGGTGDVTDSHRLWRVASNPQRIGSGVIIGDHAYVVNEESVACLALKTGKEAWDEKLPSRSWTSIVHADGKLYLVTQSGETIVFAPNPKEFEQIARNKLDGATTRASIAVSDGELFIRTYKHLWCITEKK
ncbi:MAG TPA: PQQ-binding-like beta-propeller repeat protein [Gemmataceae bacterium]|nr:PQQ-binding-like beta-propeller repeat protein [Gemmataceae bacterium]